MAKFLCVCGHVLSTSGPIPNPDEWRCLSDADFDAFAGLVNVEDIYQQSTIMYRCPASGHLWVFWRSFEEPPALYTPTALPESRAQSAEEAERTVEAAYGEGHPYSIRNEEGAHRLRRGDLCDD